MALPTLAKVIICSLVILILAGAGMFFLISGVQDYRIRKRLNKITPSLTGPTIFLITIMIIFGILCIIGAIIFAMNFEYFIS